ncbi:MAG: ABC transporter permease [Gemmatimonadota bacterium]|nr:ABC transporter permease [Gemmatimonadota bacterium]
MRALRVSAEGARSLSARKLNTFFMMAGTIVGIAALIVIMAVGSGTESKVMKRVENFGPRAMMLIAGGAKSLPPPDVTVTTLTLEDAEAVRDEIENLELAVPMAWKIRMNLKRGTNQARAVVWGVEPEWHESYNWYPAAGEPIEAQDVATLARVCVIGQTVREELFDPDEDPVGKRIFINRVGLFVKGVLESRGVSPGGRDFDNRIILPITTAMRRVMNVDYLGGIRIISEDPSFIPEQAEAIRELIHRRHHITPPQEDDFNVITPTIIAELAGGISRTLFVLLIVLASLSLIIGGVVMMNIQLVSVAARTGEIGLRRALGASRRDIFIQFLLESLAVTLLGMLMGSAVGLGLAASLAKFTQLPVIVSWQPFVVSVLFALLIGTFFGVQPARGAARLHPVEALR